ncbi:gamma-glutamyltransferase family protein [Chromohalobacter israelensis]|uniref:gamma-glutamyltransferase family protein n=1 Tax=Chromohalobacter israelensis TaxID=141390 RepID=UPI003D7AB893
MIHTRRSYEGMCVAPHHLAAEAGRDILRDGGNAIDAMVAAAASIAVTYPHMSGVGGDGFWLIHEPGKPPIAIDACGPAARLASPEWYAPLTDIPSRGPKAALTMAGTVDGWREALSISRAWNSRLPLSRLLADAIHHARQGVAVSRSQSALTAKHYHDLATCPGFADTFLSEGDIPTEGARLRQPRLAKTLEQLAQAGLQDFYQGDLADSMARDLERLGSPLRHEDFRQYRATSVAPLAVNLPQATLYNLPAPTQGISSLMILALFARLDVTQGEGFAHVHGLVEATKRAFLLRDRYVTDPRHMSVSLQSLLDDHTLEREVDAIDPRRALAWPHASMQGDTIWMGTTDAQGRSVSFIQSVYWEFGSGVVLPESGVMWQNRGTSFSLDSASLRPLAPGRKPFHTLNPALAHFHDGRTMVYGTMGGEGQPQTQAALFSRYAMFDMPLQEAISAPRWLLGRTWGEATTTLKLESRFSPGLVECLRDAGHDLEVLEAAFSDTMGHAGAIVRHPHGLLEGAHDPRSDGGAAGC